MTRNQIIELAKKYKTEIIDRKKLPKEYDKFIHVADGRGTLEHAAWMCEQIEKCTFDIEKINRWLGFVQGVLWNNSYRSIEEMCQENSNLRGEQK
jgi:hypothetical protein